jgi:hypothetical protein
MPLVKTLIMHRDLVSARARYAPFRLILFLALVVGVACVSASVKTPEQAIAIGWKACDESWGKQARQNGQTFEFRPETWHARLINDHWKVWSGDEASPGMHLDVRADGRPPDGAKECDLTFQD